MRFFDSLKMALHNLWHNKSRSILTIVIVFVVSALIMAMCLLGTNFIENQDRANKLSLEANGTSYSLSNKGYSNGGTNEDYQKLMPKVDEALNIAQIAKNHSTVVDSLYFTAREQVAIKLPNNNNQNNLKIGYTLFDFPIMPNFASVTEGRIWTAEDNDTNLFWITADLREKLTAKGISLNLGEKLTLGVQEHKEGVQEYNPIYEDFVLAGVLDPYGDSNDYYNSIPDILVSAQYGRAKFGTTQSVDRLNINFLPIVGSYNYKEVEKEMKLFVAESNAVVGEGFDEYNNKTFKRFSCSFLDDMQMTMLMGIIIMGVLILLAFLILMLSIGSVANTIIISVDKNRKFIGLMKAMGLNNKGVKGIVYKEAFITITIGILLAVLTIYLIQGAMLFLLTKIFGSMFMMIEMTVTFSISAFVPIITLAAFILFAVLFSKGALNKMGKADVMTVISEVA